MPCLRDELQRIGQHKEAIQSLMDEWGVYFQLLASEVRYGFMFFLRLMN